MKIVKNDMLSETGNVVNEDQAGMKDNVAWVIDGATGLNDEVYLPGESNASWYAKCWKKYLLEQSNSNVTISDLIINGIIQVTDWHNAINEGRKCDKLSMPTAGIGLVRWNNGKLEYFILGDCQIWIKRKSGIQVIADEELNKLDNQVIEKLKGVLKQSSNVEEGLKSIKSDLIKNRLKANVENGYWVLGFDTKAVEHAINGFIDISNDAIIEVLILSDGFYAIVEKYGFLDKNECFEMISNSGSRDVYDKLREIENLDFKMQLYPRFKKSDDASVIYLKLENETK